MVKWQFWKKDGDKKKEPTTLARLEKDGLLRVLTTDVLENRVKNLHEGLTQALETFRKARLKTLIPEEVLDRMSEAQREEYIKNYVEGIRKEREALDNIVILLTDAAWPWNRAGDRNNRMLAFIVDEFLQDYEELKNHPDYYDDLYTMALSIVQKSFREPDVTKEVPIAIFMPKAQGNQVDLRQMEEL